MPLLGNFENENFLCMAKCFETFLAVLRDTLFGIGLHNRVQGACRAEFFTKRAGADGAEHPVNLLRMNPVYICIHICVYV